MNALSLYVTTTRMLFQADIDDSGAWNDINRLMSYLRQSLTCCVCGNLLYIPMSSTVSSCQHHVCKSCVGGKMRLKPSCSWCKDHSKFIENIQLRILLQCYKQLASFILSSSMVDNWGYLVCETNQASYSSLPNNFNGPTTFRQLLEEGSNFHDKYTFSEPPPLRSFSRQTYGNNHHNYNLQNPLHQQQNNNHSNQSNFNSQQLSQNSINSSSPQTYSLNDGDSKSNTKNSISESSSNVNNTGRINSITNIGNSINIVGSIVPSITLRETMNGENTKTGILLKANPTQAITFNRNIIKADQTQFNKILTGSLINSSNNHSPVNRKVRRGCRCGLATPNPGKLTCCGQRCPCYVESKACNQCKCRGCRNPNKVSNLTTINIISSGSSSSSTTTTTTATSTSMSVSTSTTPSTASYSLTSKPSETSSLISIPAGIASNLFQIPIVNNESLVKDICNNQVLLTTNLETESLLENVKNSKDLTFESQII